MQTRLFYAFVLLLALSPFSAYSDGVFIWDKGTDLYEPTQRALIHFGGGRETLILQVRYAGPTKDFGWLVPVPEKPEVSVIASDDSPFAELSLFSQKRLRLGFRSSERTEQEEVQVITRSVLGIYDVTVLSASEPALLADWFSANGYLFPNTKAHLLKHYTDKRWFYIALRIDPEALEADAARQLSTGEIQPLRIRFRSEEPVYPLKITSANAGETELLLYVLAGTPMAVSEDQYVSGFSVGPNLPRGRRWADPAFGTFKSVQADSLPRTWKALQIDADQSLYLMKYRVTFDTDEIVDDLVFLPLDPKKYWQMHLQLKEGAEPLHVDRGMFVKRKIEQAKERMSEGTQLEGAISALEEAILATPPEDTSWAVWLRGYTYAMQGNYGRALSDFKEAGGVNGKNAQAWLYATCPDPVYRHGKRAIWFAEQALVLCKDCGRDNLINTLAAAYAEDGQFDSAVSLLQEITDRLGPNTPEEYVKQLQSYREQRPWREAWQW